jgi:hypothetical protein
MARAVVVRSYPLGPRVWIGGQRVHHGSVGIALLAAGLRKHRTLLAAGLLLAAHDWRDWRVWFMRESIPPASSLCDASHTAKP